MESNELFQQSALKARAQLQCQSYPRGTTDKQNRFRLLCVYYFRVGEEQLKDDNIYNVLQWKDSGNVRPSWEETTKYDKCYRA